jgi:hypothetical protein
VTIINILPIFRKHFETLKKDTNTFWIVFLFIAIPFVISFTLVYTYCLITETSINSLITAFAIFVGFIINVIVLLINTARKNGDSTRKLLIEHLFYNTLYELVLGIIILTLSLFVNFVYLKLSSSTLVILSFFIYFLLINFLITLLQITRRMFVLFGGDVK